MSNIAIKVENISKLYRIGLKEEIHDTFSGVLFDYIKSPLKNYRKYRSLYKFDDIKPDEDSNPSNIIWALRDVSFEVKEGEVLGIIGANGAGKSTLLKILSRITPPTKGHAKIHGRVSTLLEVGTGFNPELTGRENIYLNGTILGMTKKEVDCNFDEIVDFSGVEKFIDTPVKRYSSGMKLRLAFAVSAHLEPEIIIIDEVLAVGDARFQEKCMNKMQDVRQKGRTIIFVSHNMHAITRLCERVILLDEGRIIMDGLSHQVVSAYLSTDHPASNAERKWPDPSKAPGGEFARLLAVRVRTEDGQVTDKVDVQQRVAIDMEYEVLKSGHLLLPHYHFFNEEGIHVFSSHDLDPAWKGRNRPAGHYVSTAWIPDNLLSEGMLFVEPVLITLSPIIIQFCERNAISFQVVNILDGDSSRGNWLGHMGGAVRPLLKWNTQFRSNEKINKISS